MIVGDGLSWEVEGFFLKPDGFLNSPSRSFSFSPLTLLPRTNSPDSPEEDLEGFGRGIFSDLKASFPERTGVSNPREPRKSRTDLEGGSEIRGGGGGSLFEEEVGLSIAAIYSHYQRK